VKSAWQVAKLQLKEQKKAHVKIEKVAGLIKKEQEQKRKEEKVEGVA
jgi:hypothetical protein